MTSSPLTAALLGLDTDTKDPRYGPSRRKLGLAASMYQTASDTSPTTPLGGLARALTAIPGAFLSAYGQQEADELGAADKADAAKWGAALDFTPSKPISSLSGSMPPQTQTAPPPQSDIIGGGAPVASRADLEPIVAEAAARHGLPPELAKALFQQESSFGTDPAAKGNIGQVIGSTAANPGYGIEPLAPGDLTTPGKNVDFSLRYLKARGEEAGVKDWKDPQQWALALKAYNGGGDPKYVEHVAQYLPSGTAVRSGGTDYAGPGAPQTDGTPPPAGSPPGQQPQIGMNSPRMQQAMEEMQRARQALSSINPNNPAYPRIKQQAELLIEHAKMLSGLEEWVQLPNGDQLSTRTGKIERGPQHEQWEQLPDGSQRNRTTGKIEQPPGFAAPRSPERMTQDEKLAAAGRPSVETKIYGAGAEKAFENVAKAWQDQQTAVQTANKMDARIGMFERAMDTFNPGIDSELRLKGQQALSALGFKNNAPAGEVMLSLQRQIELGNTPKGQGQITENERVLIREANNLIGSTPEGAKMLIAATRSANDYERKVGQIYIDSAKRNGGTPNPTEIAEGLQNLGPVLPPEIEMQLETLHQQSKTAKPADTAGTEQPPATGQSQTGQVAQPQTAPPMPGARQAPDGNWYTPDPKRPGKYLQVE